MSAEPLIALTVALLGGGGLLSLLTYRAQNKRIAAETERVEIEAEARRKEAEAGVERAKAEAEARRTTSAVELAEAYGHQIDRLETELDRQGKELIALREHITELLRLIGARDEEIAVLRGELAQERDENDQLRQRVNTLEAKLGRRSTDPPSPPPLHAA